MQEKTCKGCGLAKPLSEYYANKACAMGVTTFCKGCTAEKRKADRKANPGKYKAWEDADRIRNGDARRARCKQWHDQNKERQSAYNKRLYQAKREAILEQKRQYRLANRDKIYVLNGERRAIERRARLRSANAVAMADMYRLARNLTKQTGIAHHVDHIVPLKGDNVCGLHVEWNMQVITAAENIAKRNIL